MKDSHQQDAKLHQRKQFINETNEMKRERKKGGKKGQNKKNSPYQVYQSVELCFHQTKTAQSLQLCPVDHKTRP